MRPATSSAFEDIKIGQLAKSRCYSRQPHDLSAAGAKRRCWRALIRAFVGPGQSSSLEPEMSPDTLVRCPLSTESRRWKLATLRQRFVAMRQSRRMSSRRMSNGQSFAHQPRRSPRSPRSAPIKFFEIVSERDMRRSMVMLIGLALAACSSPTTPPAPTVTPPAPTVTVAPLPPPSPPAPNSTAAQLAAPWRHLPNPVSDQQFKQDKAYCATQANTVQEHERANVMSGLPEVKGIRASSVAAIVRLAHDLRGARSGTWRVSWIGLSA